MGRLPNFELLERLEQTIATECIKRGGPWQVTLMDLADMLGEHGKYDKIWRLLNNLSEAGTIMIIKSGNRDANSYRYIGRQYEVSAEYQRAAALIQSIQVSMQELFGLMAGLKDKDGRMLQSLKGLRQVGQTGEGFLYSSSESIADVLYDCGLGEK